MTLTLCSRLRHEIYASWQLLPLPFRLERPLKHYHHRSPVEQDLMLSARLNHLHVLFLYDLALAGHVIEAKSRLIDTAADMLRLTVEAVTMRDRLINSGTGLIWRVRASATPLICRS